MSKSEATKAPARYYAPPPGGNQGPYGGGGQYGQYPGQFGGQSPGGAGPTTTVTQTVPEVFVVRGNVSVAVGGLAISSHSQQQQAGPGASPIVSASALAEAGRALASDAGVRGGAQAAVADALGAPPADSGARMAKLIGHVRGELSQEQDVNVTTRAQAPIHHVLTLHTAFEVALPTAARWSLSRASAR